MLIAAVGHPVDGEKRSSILCRLRHETRDLHDAIEQEVDLERCLSSRAAYRSWLVAWWGFLAATEPILAKHLDAAIFGPRRKMHLLRHDLRNLALTDREIDALPIWEPTHPPSSVGEALGALYVIEGSTLGGQIIARQAIEALGASIPLCFLRPYGPDVGAMWQQFRRQLCDHASPMSDDIVVGSAKTTFYQLSKWFRACREK